MNGLFFEYADASLDIYQPQNPSQEHALHVVKKYIDNVEENLKAGIGLSFLGMAGLGKTFLAEVVLKEAKAQKYGVESITASGFVRLHQKQYDRNEDPDVLASVERQIRRIHFKTDLVLFDDVGREHDPGTGYASGVVFEAMRDRYNRKLSFVITSNLDSVGLQERYSESFVSMLSGKTHVIELNGEDYRRAAGAIRD
jgi:DNA replication protein DnaC